MAWRLAALLLGLLLAVPARAHDLGWTDVHAFFGEDATYRVDLLVDPRDVPEVVPGWDPRAPAPDGVEEALSRWYAQAVTLEVDGVVLEARPEIPGLSEPAGLARVVRLEGPLPPEARDFRLRGDEELGPLMLVTHVGRETSAPIFLYPGQPSPSIDPSAAVPSGIEVFGRYLVLGFTHILPKGLDHVLFVLGLFLLSTRLRPLLVQVTAFTAAHTVTLGLTVAGWLPALPHVVEPLIALSIAWIGVENVVVRELKPWRPAVVFGFGLLHGMGFAGVLSELGLPSGRLATGLLAFNVGVELGQLAVLALALAVVGWARDLAGYRRWVVVPASVGIALMGALWTVERLLPSP